MRGCRRLRRPLRVDDELADAAAVAEIDEDETTVVAAPRDPARQRQTLPDMLGSRLAAHDVTPLAHGESLPSTLSCDDRLVLCPVAPQERVGFDGR